MNTQTTIVQKLSAICKQQYLSLENEYIIDENLNVVLVKEANPSYYNTHKKIFQAFQEFLTFMEFASTNTKEATVAKLKERFQDNEPEFTDFIFSVVAFSEKTNQQNENYKSMVNTINQNPSFKIEKIKSILDKTEYVLQTQLSDFLEVVYDVGLELFPIKQNTANEDF